jgi:hypothetical protein
MPTEENTMPCNSDYMQASNIEVELSRVACLLDELDGKPINPSHWRGYHPAIYCRVGSVNADSLVAELCSRLQNTDVTKHSLEMQMWWRDHKIADKARLEMEIRLAKEKEDKEKAIAKLTPYERELLGL